MVNGVGAAGPRIDFNPTDVADLPQATVQARFQIAAVKAQQDMMRLQGQELLRLMEPEKGVNLDRRV